MDRVTEEDDEQEDSDEKLLNTALKKYLRYFLPTYVGTMDTVTNKRVKPRIDMSLWNKYEAVTEGAEDLTNNVAENFNSVSKGCLPMKPNVVDVLESIQREDLHAKT